MKLGRDGVLMVPYKCCCFSARSAQRWIQDWVKIGQRLERGAPFIKGLFLQTGKLQQQTECIAMNLKYVGRSVVIHVFHSIPKSNFWLRHIGLFSCNLYRLLCSKVLNLHLFCVISVFKVEECYWYMKDLNTWNMNVLCTCIYLGKGRGGMYVYVWKHIFSLLLQNRLTVCFIVYETWHFTCVLGFLARSAQGWIKGETKIGHGGISSSKGLQYRSFVSYTRGIQKLMQLGDFLGI